ncbi:MAG: hypothetical protein C0424_05135 [Sphingobacteriaceae bacterium]|nr:hypothetical protein [Sphingobacteriaceae bacterium]
MKSALFCFCFMCHLGPAPAQFVDHFTDGNFSQNPSWQGDSTHFIVNPQGQLQLAAPALSTRGVLSTRSRAIHQTSWEWWMRLDFNPSSANYVDVYLTSNRPELDSSLQGYFVRVGNTTDEVSLYRQTGITRTEIIDGLDGLLDRNSSRLRIRVSRNSQGQWQLESDTTGTGNQYRLEGSVVDATHAWAEWFGLRHVFSSSRANHFFYDDFVVNGSPAPDTLLPRIIDARITTMQAIQLTFNKPLPQAQLNNRTAYQLLDVGPPFRSSSQNDSTVLLEWLLPFNTESWLEWRIRLSDSAANELDTLLRLFHLPFVAGRLVINELLADPSPTVGLPETEMVEIYNNSPHPHSLVGWTLEDPQTRGRIPNCQIPPGAYLLLVPPGNAQQWAGFGPCVEVNPWPSLNNDRDQLWLRNETGQVSDSMLFERSWLGSSIRQEGGWTLERLSPGNFCPEASNWQGSLAVIGGTPGAANSRLGQYQSPPPPQLQLVRWHNDSLYLHFSAAVRLGKVESPNHRIEANQLQFNSLQQLYFPQTPNTSNQRITVSQWADCHGQQLAETNWELAIAEMHALNQIQFSEIYFRPINGGASYLELVNSGAAAIPLHSLWLSSLDAQEVPLQSARLGMPGDFILPSQQLVFTRDTAAVHRDFGVISAQNRRQISNLPTIYTAGGRFMLSNDVQEMLSATAYHDSMHHSQLAEKRGMALEKPQGQWQLGWGSPVFAKRGSPGMPNSRIVSSASDQQWWDVPQEIFRPRQLEELNIQLFGTAESWIQIEIFDVQGRSILNLFPYQALTGSLSIRWNGNDENGQLVPTGAYVLVLNYTLSSGERGRKMKRVVVDNFRP